MTPICNSQFWLKTLYKGENMNIRCLPSLGYAASKAACHPCCWHMVILATISAPTFLCLCSFFKPSSFLSPSLTSQSILSVSQWPSQE